MQGLQDIVGGAWGANLLNMSETISTSVSAAAIFSAEESWGRPPKRKDIVSGTDYFSVGTLRKKKSVMAISCIRLDPNS